MSGHVTNQDIENFVANRYGKLKPAERDAAIDAESRKIAEDAMRTKNLLKNYKLNPKYTPFFDGFVYGINDKARRRNEDE